MNAKVSAGGSGCIDAPTRRARGRKPASSGARDAGMVTAEAAVVLPSMVLVLSLCLGAVDEGIRAVRAVDTCRSIVRATSRGDDPDVVGQLARQDLPTGATTTVQTQDGRVVARVMVPGGYLIGHWIRWPSITTTAVALAEEGLP